jgi:AcrR family transcriptional regulator
VSTPSERPEGVRERTKREKRRRIIAAARAVFLERGFEGATTREIADRAQIGRGTLFLYASDKRDLHLMVVNDDLDEITSAAFDAVPADAPLLEQLLRFFEPRYVFWGAEPVLSRTAMQLMGGSYAPGTPGTELARGIERRANSGAHLVLILRRHARSDVPDEALSAASQVIFAIYVTQLRLWLNDETPLVPDGIERLRRLLTVAISGIEGVLQPAVRTGYSAAARRAAPS